MFVVNFFPLQSSGQESLDWSFDVRMSLIIIKNNVTLITEPYGTPLRIMVGLEKVLFVFTWMVLFERKFLIKVRMLRLILVRASMIFILEIES